MKLNYYLRWFYRFAASFLSLRVFRFAGKKADPSLITDAWHSITVSMPIITPPGQEDMFVNKIHNITLAINKMDWLMLRPGEIFSFWRLVGRPTVRSGFKIGTSFINNTVQKDIGGGLCQISSVLYCAAFRYGLKIIERRSHSIDAYDEVRYFPLGQDATVTFPAVDLQFQNNQSEVIIIRCILSESSVIVKIYSPRVFFNTEIMTEIIKRIPRRTQNLDKTLTIQKAQMAEQKGSDGKIVKTTRTIFFNDNRQPFTEEYIDLYKPVDEIHFRN